MFVETSKAKFRLSVLITGFDTFTISTHDARTDATISVLVYQLEDFPTGIDLDSHVVDCMIANDGTLIRTAQE